MTSVSLHRVTRATARIGTAPSTSAQWLELVFVDDAGAEMEVTLFSKDASALLASIAASSRSLDVEVTGAAA